MPAMPPLRVAQLQGEMQAVTRGRQPRTVAQILSDARREMEYEDLYWAWLRNEPLPPRIRRPRRKLRAWLSGAGRNRHRCK